MWWMRCERCEGRLAEGRVAQRGDMKVLEGWTPPGVAGQATAEQEVKLTGSWTCGLCQRELQQGTASVLTGVGRICIPCRTGPGRKQAHAPPEDEAPQAPPADRVPLNSAQVQYLQEILTVQQWQRLTALA